jgi:NTE family protein
MGSNGHQQMKRRLDLPGLLGGRRRVAFVLSGGGSLGAAQVGMLQALFDGGIKPDILVGTSVGAVNAAWIGASPDSEGARRLAEIWTGLRRDNVFPLGWTAAMGLLGRGKHLISNGALRGILERHLPYERLEQAQLPVHAVTTELTSGRAIVLSSGPAVPALLASCAIPGVFPPVTIGRHELVDGGVANHTPIAAAVELGARVIYVLPIGYPWLHEEPANALGMALQALARLVEQRLESEIAGYRDVADIRVVPAIQPLAVSPADFSRTRELIERGYASADKLVQTLSRGRLEVAPRLRRAPGLSAVLGG